MSTDPLGPDPKSNSTTSPAPIKISIRRDKNGYFIPALPCPYPPYPFSTITKPTDFKNPDDSAEAARYAELENFLDTWMEDFCNKNEREWVLADLEADKIMALVWEWRVLEFRKEAPKDDIDGGSGVLVGMMEGLGFKEVDGSGGDGGGGGGGGGGSSDEVGNIEMEGYEEMDQN